MYCSVKCSGFGREKNRWNEVDLVGQVFKKLTVIEEICKPSESRFRWKCVCQCGNITILSTKQLRTFKRKSCGECPKKLKTPKPNKLPRVAVVRPPKLKKLNRLHKEEYTCWLNMKVRCYNPKFIGFADYGGRGIKVCERWLISFENFFDDMGKRPSSEHSLDRYPDFNGNYEPLNCRWATRREQCKNRRNNNWIDYNGTTMIASEWARLLNITPSTILQNLKNGVPFSKVYNKYIDTKTNLQTQKNNNLCATM